MLVLVFWQAKLGKKLIPTKNFKLSPSLEPGYYSN